MSFYVPKYDIIYDKIPMIVHMKSEYRIEKIDNGLDGLLIKEVEVKPNVSTINRSANKTSTTHEVAPK